MKLVVFGLSVTSSWGNGHATIWRGLLRALGAAGHEPVFFERDVPYYAAHRDLTGGRGYRVVLYPSWEEALPRARREISSADVAIVTSYCADAKDAARLVVGSRAFKIFYDLDTPVTLDALARGEDVPYVPSLGLGAFDLVLSYTGGPALDGLRKRLGARRVAPLYGSVDLETHHPCGAREREWDLSYLGTYSSDRQAGVEALLFEPARRLRRGRFLLGGPKYPNDILWPENVFWRSHVAPHEHADFYGTSRLTLSVTRAPMARYGWCPSGRLFEAAACGVPIVTDAFPGLEEFFEPESEVIVARSTDDVVRALSLSASTLSILAARARARTLAEHTAERRAAELVDIVERLRRAS